METRTTLFPRAEVIELLADAYAQAARQEADMRVAAELLEAVRTCLLTESDIFRIWAELDNQVGRADADRVRPVISRLRDRVEQAANARALAAVNDAFARSAAEGWTLWCATYINAFDIAGWRTSLCLALAEDARSRPPPPQFTPEQISYFTRCIRHSRWAETGDWFLFLSEQPTSPSLRARLLVIIGEIELFHYLRPDRARDRFQEASNLEPEGLRTFVGWSEYWLKTDNLKEARRAAEEAIRVSPTLKDGYIVLGESYEKEQDFTAAQDCYQRAIRGDPGSASGYQGLQRLWGRVELFAERRDRLPGLIKQITSLEPELAYTARLDQGGIFRQNKLYAEAHAEFNQAVALDKTRHDAYASDGYVWLDQAYEPNRDKTLDPQLFAQARQCFQTTIEKAPEALDGYWGMSWLAEQQEQWADAVRWCEESLPRRPQWETTIRNRLGDLRRKMGDLQGAEQQLLRVLELEPGNKQAFSALNDVGDDYYLKAGKPDEALRIFTEVRQKRGEIAEPAYQNRVGNLRYYHSDYKAAAEAYRKAAAAKPEEAVYHSNLALALERLKTPGSMAKELSEAMTELLTAKRLAPDTKEYQTRLAALQVRLDFIASYGESALEFIPVLMPIRVFIAQQWHPLLLSDDRSNLSQPSQEAINALRDRIRETYGIALPGIHFADFEPPATIAGSYGFSLFEVNMTQDEAVPLDRLFVPAQLEQLKAVGIDEGQPSDVVGLDGFWILPSERAKLEARGLECWTPFDFFFRAMELFLIANLAALATYQDAANLLVSNSKRSAGDEIPPQDILSLLHHWREHLRQRKDLESFNPALAAQRPPPATIPPQPPAPPGVGSAEIPRIPSLALFIGEHSALDRAALAEMLPSIQLAVFQHLGLITPRITLASDPTLAPRDFCLELNGRRLPSLSGADKGEFWTDTPLVELDRAGIAYRPADHPDGYSRAAFVSNSLAKPESFIQNGRLAFDTENYVVYRVASLVREHDAELMTEMLAAHYLSLLERSHPRLVLDVRRVIPSEAFTRALQTRLARHETLRHFTETLELILAQFVFAPATA